MGTHVRVTNLETGADHVLPTPRSLRKDSKGCWFLQESRNPMGQPTEVGFLISEADHNRLAALLTWEGWCDKCRMAQPCDHCTKWLGNAPPDPRTPGQVAHDTYFHDIDEGPAMHWRRLSEDERAEWHASAAAVMAWEGKVSGELTRASVDPAELGRRLRWIRQDIFDMTMGDLARVTGLTVPQISAAETRFDADAQAKIIDYFKRAAEQVP